jgi:hypothetical protein
MEGIQATMSSFSMMMDEDGMPGMGTNPVSLWTGILHTMFVQMRVHFTYDLKRLLL